MGAGLHCPGLPALLAALDSGPVPSPCSSWCFLSRVYCAFPGVQGVSLRTPEVFGVLSSIEMHMRILLPLLPHKDCKAGERGVRRKREGRQGRQTERLRSRDICPHPQRWQPRRDLSVSALHPSQFRLRWKPRNSCPLGVLKLNPLPAHT